MRVCIVGNSVGFKLRPPRRNADDLTYAEILRQNGHDVRNVSKAGVMLAEQFGLLDDDVITHSPDAVVLHHGIIEVFHRRTVRRWNNAAIPNQYRNRVSYASYRFGTMTQSVAHFVWRAANALTRMFARAFGLHWQWQPTVDFVTVVRSSCELLLKETAARVIVVGISPPAEHAARGLPGLEATIAAANAALAALCVELGPRVEFLDVDALLGAQPRAEHISDGIHFSAAGHRLVARSLLDRLGRSSAG